MSIERAGPVFMISEAQFAQPFSLPAGTKLPAQITCLSKHRRVYILITLMLKDNFSGVIGIRKL